MTLAGSTRVFGVVYPICFCLLLIASQDAFAVTATDNFNRVNGGLGPNWTDITDGGLTISSEQVVGTNAASTSGDIRTAETYASDQFSQIQITSTQLSGGQWIGAAVRAQSGGDNLYTGIYYWNNGAPLLMLFKRFSGGWTQLGSSFASGPLAAGTQLQLAAIGSSLTFSENGTAVITATDTSLTGGAPGIIAYGTSAAGNWAGGDNSSSSTYSVSGNVSGLSGTVVLQNNGGDNLSINGNGLFTFGTQLALGASYNVTVETSLAGQSCSVANGSGTIVFANVTNITLSCTANLASDNFNRANGSLGPNWTDITDGGLAISSEQVVGTNAGSNSGDIRTAESYASDQYSQIQITSVQLSGGQWIGPAVRAQNGGQSLYTGIYYWNSGNPLLMLFKRSSGTWTQLGSSYASGALAAGTQLQLSVIGSTLTFSENGTAVIAASDTSLTDGAPGIIAYGTPTAGDWAGGDNPSSTYSIGGTVSGLSGTVVLQDNGGNSFSVSANGLFTFGAQFTSGATYAVTVETNPTGQTCSVTNGTGTIASASITNIAVSCVTSSTATYSVGGTITGLSGTIVLQDNGSDDLSVSANGSFIFTTQLASGAAYNAIVETNPTGQSCSVANGSGTIASANVTNLAVVCTTSSGNSASDNFARADGSIGPNWTDMTDGGLVISGDEVVGTNAASTSGDIRTAETYASDQFSQIQIASTQLSGGQWIGPAVRAQNGGQNLYTGIYYWNNGSPMLMLFKRSGSNWTQLGNTYSCGPLPAGTQLKLMIVGNTLSFLENGLERIAAGDTSLTGGAPGIIAYGTSAAGNWSGGNAGFEVHYLSTDANGVESYDVISANNGYGPQVLRVLHPTQPAAGVAHNFIYALPVEAGLGTDFGDGLATLAAVDAQDQYNLTIIAPSFDIDPWYANNPNDLGLQYETFMTAELQPWVVTNLSTSGTEQHWLIGFSKSGIGGQDLILKHPDLFTLAASWDFPADMSSYDQFGADSADNYGTDANFQTNYRLTQSFLVADETPFLTNNRIWIGSYNAFEQDVADYDTLLTSVGIIHTTGTPQNIPHRWDSGWVPGALTALYQDSINQH